MTAIDKLKEVQDARKNKYVQALQKSPVELAERVASAQTTFSEIQPQFFKAQAWLLKGIMALLVVLILEASFIMVLLLRKPSIEQRETQPRLVRVSSIPEVKASAKTETTASATTTKSSKVTKSSSQK